MNSCSLKAESPEVADPGPRKGTTAYRNHKGRACPSGQGEDNNWYFMEMSPSTAKFRFKTK